MTAIWHNDGSSWRVLSPVGFPDEAALHALVADAPQLLPLSGSPRLVVLGREVRLGTGWADLLAVEPTGRLAVIEVKLAKNAEARRAVIAQVLTYAAYLRGTDPDVFERDVVGLHLAKHGHQTVLDAVVSSDQEGSIDAGMFREGLADSLKAGRFRLVLVLDEAPSELVRLVGYLESVARELVIDLVTVAAYQVAGNRLLVPQRVDPERQPTIDAAPSPTSSKAKGELVEGADQFLEAIQSMPEDRRPSALRLHQWATELERQGLAKLVTFRGAGGRCTLLPYVKGEQVGLVTIWSDGGLSLWRSVFERRAPALIPEVEAAIAPVGLKQGSWVTEVTDELLQLLRSAYDTQRPGQR